MSHCPFGWNKSTSERRITTDLSDLFSAIRNASYRLKVKPILMLLQIKHILFIVQTPHTSIRVTGTSFNVRAYADEEVESTTLISGAIEISSENEDYELIPNQHFVYDKNSRESTVSNVNTELYTSWESGSFIFMNVPLENVMSYLSKWYGFTYTFEDEAAKQVQIGAYLNRYANMNPIIDMIMELNMVDIKQREGILHISYKQ